MAKRKPVQGIRKEVAGAVQRTPEGAACEAGKPVRRRNRTSRQSIPLESSIVAGCIKYLNSLPKCRARKVSGTEQRGGEPDIDACLGGKSLKIEVKRPAPCGTPLTALQAATLRQWKEAGAITGVVTGVAELKELIIKGDKGL